MNELPPPLTPRRVIDLDHIKLLAIFHFVGAGLAVLGIMFLAVHYAMMHAFLSDPKIFMPPNPPAGPPPGPPVELFKHIAGVMVWFYAIFGGWYIVSGILNVISGIFLLGRKNRTFSLIVAGLNCVHIPLGTILGVFTIIVLLRDSVRSWYDEEAGLALDRAGPLARPTGSS